MTAATVNIGVVGLGYWGPNLARNFAALPDAEVTWLCDASEAALERQRATHPKAKSTGDLDDLLADESLDAVVIAANVPQHAPLATRVLDAGKHVFVEKPLGATLAETEQFVATADATDRIVMVGHLLEYHPGIERLKRLVDDGELGEILYVYSNRLNLGQLRADENALWSLGPHDVSVALALIGEEPDQISARGESYMRPGIEDVVFGHLRFPSGIAAHLHLSWLDPHKERRVTVVGRDRMATFDDMKVEGKLAVYDKGFDQDFKSHSEYMARSGDIWQPRISNEEPLRIECRHFVECVRSGATPRTDAHSGLRVVRVLEGLQNSLDASSRAAAAAKDVVGA
ncbi:MAG: Gfo/Idh/MocA family oxidoreductase [Solirubrobacterales bacterium]